MNRIRIDAVLLTIVVTLSARAAMREIADDGERVPQRVADASQIIRLADDIRLFLVPTELPEEPQAVVAYLGPRRMAVSDWIAERMAPGTVGQIRAAALSADGTELAICGGWRAPDGVGRNGVFVLRRDGSGWRLMSVIEKRMTFGPIAFGPDDTILVLTHEIARSNAPEGAPIATAFSRNGDIVAELFAPKGLPHATRGRAAFGSRIQRLEDGTYAVYDHHTHHLYFVDASLKIVRDVHVPLSHEQTMVIAFGEVAGGRLLLARSFRDGRRGGTDVALYDRTGAPIERWSSPVTWPKAELTRHGIDGYAPGADRAWKRIHLSLE